jgi:ketosteroid isomerase-like protein
VTALDDLDLWIEQSHVAWDEFVKGNPEPAKNLYSHRDDVALANPFGSIVRGWKQVAETMERAASYYEDGKAISFEIITKFATSDLACIVEEEQYEAKIGGRDDVVQVTLRVTSVLRPEDGTWKIVHRHADPLTTVRSADSLLPNSS